MGSFSNLIDISSFFIGVLINLLLVALVCYYFKRKIDNLEVSQSEQAKMLYSLISRQEQQQQHFMMTTSQENNNSGEPAMSESNLNFLQNLDLNSLGTTHNSIVEMPNMQQDGEDSDSDSGSETGSESGSESESDNEEVNVELSETKVLTLNQENEPETSSVTMESEEQEVKEIQYNEVSENSHNFDYEKMTIKELKSIIENRGLHAKKNSKKQELIELLVQQQEEVVSVEKIGETNIVSLSDEELEQVISEDEEQQLVDSEPEILIEDENELNEIEG
jgi:hypothetical protein